jgi:hypothetical protein
MRKSLYLLLTIFFALRFAPGTKAQTIPPITGATSICVGSTNVLIDSIVGGKWSSSDTSVATVDSVLGIVTGISVGTATIIYTIGTDFVTTGITIDTFLYAGVITGPDSVCAGATITLTDTVPNGMWLCSNTHAIDSAGITTGLSAGLDTIMYILSNSCGADTAFKVIKINPLPSAGLIIGFDVVCIGKTITLSASSAGGTWINSNSSASISAAGLLSGISVGKDTIGYIVANSCGSDTATKIVTIATIPDPGIISGPDVLCVGENIFLSDTMKKGVWSSSNADVALSGSVMVTGITVGIDTIWYKVSNTCGIDTATWIVTVNPLPPLPPITRVKNLLSVPTGYVTYQWTMNGNNILGATNNIYNVTSLQNYYAIVTNSFGCSIASPFQTITELECNPDEIRIYPNPASSVINIDWCRKVTVNISCMDGKTIWSLKNINTIDLSLLPNASYILHIFDVNGNKLQTKQIKKISQ